MCSWCAYHYILVWFGSYGIFSHERYLACVSSVSVDCWKRFSLPSLKNNNNNNRKHFLRKLSQTNFADFW